MSLIHSAELDDLLRLAKVQFELSKAAPFARIDFLKMVWDDTMWALRSTPDLNARIDRTRNLVGIMAAFVSMSQDENMALLAPHNGDPVASAARKRAIMDTRPALAAWHLETDALAVLADTAAREAAVAKAERDHAARPALVLGLLRASGVDLTLDSNGRLCAPAMAILDVGFGEDIFTDRRADFVAILRAEAASAAAEAARHQPVPIE